MNIILPHNPDTKHLVANDQWLDGCRLHRDRLLAESDWAMLADAPTDKAEWGAYRQALRDFPATWEPGPVADFPNPPGYVESVEPEPEAEPELPVEPLAE
jgi:hypothetical protein